MQDPKGRFNHQLTLAIVGALLYGCAGMETVQSVTGLYDSARSVTGGYHAYTGGVRPKEGHVEIIREVKGLGFKVVGKRCDCCQLDWRSHRSLEEEFELFEFTRIEVRAGYAAVRFVDGDRLAADLCQYCAHARLSSFLRHLGNEFEIPPTPEQVEEAEDLWMEALYGRERPTTVH